MMFLFVCPTHICLCVNTVGVMNGKWIYDHDLVNKGSSLHFSWKWWPVIFRCFCPCYFNAAGPYVQCISITCLRSDYIKQMLLEMNSSHPHFSLISFPETGVCNISYKARSSLPLLNINSYPFVNLYLSVTRWSDHITAIVGLGFYEQHGGIRGEPHGQLRPEGWCWLRTLWGRTCLFFFSSYK